MVRHYAKYKCRGCNRYVDRDETHASFSDLLDGIILPDAELKKLKTKLVAMFNAKHHETKGEVQRLEAINSNVKQSIVNKVEAVTDPTNAFIKDEIMASIQKLKTELADNEEKITSLSNQHETDLDEFMAFAFDFLSNKGKQFFGLSGDDMKRCKQLVFTGKIYVDENKNVYTHDISPIFSSQTNKKDLSETEKSFMVRVWRL